MTKVANAAVLNSEQSGRGKGIKRIQMDKEPRLQESGYHQVLQE